MRPVAPHTSVPSTVYVGVLIGTPLAISRFISWPATSCSSENSSTRSTSVACGVQLCPAAISPTNGYTR